MSVICNIRYDATKFNWNAHNGPYAEASDLVGGAGRPFRMGPVYNDAADIGFVLINPKTGTEAVYYLSNKVMDAECDDVAAWEFLPTAETVRKFPNLEGRKLTVYND